MSETTRTMQGRPVVAGSAAGEAVVSAQPISLWGGLDAKTGEIIDRRHELSGQCVTGKVFVLPRGKGSSTGSAVLLDSIRAGTAPAAIVLGRLDPIIALGAIVADEMWHKSIPVVGLADDDLTEIKTGDRVGVEADGTVTVEASGSR